MPRVGSTVQRFNNSTILICNRQRTKKINSRRLKEIAEALLAELQITKAELGINMVGAREMALVNETFLQHEGPTDVITFDHRNCEGRRAKWKFTASCLFAWTWHWPKRRNSNQAGGRKLSVTSSTAFYIWSAMTI